jgi:hypothetical protein
MLNISIIYIKDIIFIELNLTLKITNKVESLGITY